MCAMVRMSRSGVRRAHIQVQPVAIVMVFGIWTGLPVKVNVPAWLSLTAYVSFVVNVLS